MWKRQQQLMTWLFLEKQIAHILLFDSGLPPVGTGFMTGIVLLFENDADQKFVDIVSTCGLQKNVAFRNFSC